MDVETYKAEYIWVDGTDPTPQLRSKTKILEITEVPPMWGFDGSSTNQAPGSDSDCVLRPVFTCKDPTRPGERDKLVLCEVFDTDFLPHKTNTRTQCALTYLNFEAQEPLFGIEQEYTFFKNGRPLGFPESGEPEAQGKYYCGVGVDKVFGREIVEEHLDACLKAGLSISGINAEVMPGQWEFQVGPLSPVQVSDELLVARWLLQRVAEKHNVAVSFEPKPVQGDWNGAGAHTNFSTSNMRHSYDECLRAIRALEGNHELHINNYGVGIEDRLTGLHETCPYNTFRYGVSDRGASVRIPWQVERDDKGYIEDRRPNANCDPYTVTRLIVNTVCRKLEKRG